MKSKKIVALCLLLFIPLLAMAKKETVKYVVSDVQGRVEMVTAKGKQRLSKGDVVSADATLNVPFNGSISGMAITNRANNMRTLRVNNPLDQSVLKTVLVVEDEESNYELVRIVLQKRYNLLRAHNGIEAVMMNEEEHPDLILMDVRMPEMDGLDATRIIKEVNNKVPIIILSAFAFPENIRKAKAAGCDEFMAKPFNVEDLIEKIEHFISK